VRHRPFHVVGGLGMPGARVQLLDGFALSTASAPRLLPVGMQRLVALLAVRGPSPRSLVAGTLWPEVPEAHALACLRTLIWRLRGTVPGLVDTAGVGLALADGWPVDSREQQTVAALVLRTDASDAAWVWSQAGILLRGELLPGWYDDWVVLERERLTQLRLHALEHAASVLLACGRTEEALQLVLEAVRVAPLRESATRLLIGVHLAEDNLADALHHYELFCRMLRHELGLEPSPALAALVATSAAARAAPAPPSAPARLEPLTG
jgi:DNA-binding SARP family transcriptional activator